MGIPVAFNWSLTTGCIPKLQYSCDFAFFFAVQVTVELKRFSFHIDLLLSRDYANWAASDFHVNINPEVLCSNPILITVRQGHFIAVLSSTQPALDVLHLACAWNQPNNKFTVHTVFSSQLFLEL